MNEYIKEGLAGLLGGLITSATAVGTALQETALVDITPGQWVMVGMGGFIAAATTWKALLARPPRRTEK